MSEAVKIIISGDTCTEGKDFFTSIINTLQKNNIETYSIRNRFKNSADTLPFSKICEYFINEEHKASLNNGEKCVTLIEDGLFFAKKYADKTQFTETINRYELSEDLIRNSYEAVFYLKNKGDDEFLLSQWTGTAHLRIIDLDQAPEQAFAKLEKETLAVLGIPEPLEIERKFLIEYPDITFLNSIKTCRKIPITQTYFKTPTEGNFRLRKRGLGESTVYIKTIKQKISEIKRIEIESFISKDEYDFYMKMKDYICATISKDRYCIALNSTYFELDVFPFWKDKALLEIELLSENEKYALPDFAKLIREVSFEPEYRNLALAQVYGKIL